MGEGQGHFGKISYYGYQTSNTFAVTNIWHRYGHQDKGHLKVKIFPESNCKCFNFYQEAGSRPSTVRHSSLNLI